MFGVENFNVCIRFIWLNLTYIMPNFCRTILYIYRAVGKTLCYHKCALIWSLLFLCSVVTEHEFISDFIVVVNSIYISANISLIICI